MERGLAGGRSGRRRERRRCQRRGDCLSGRGWQSWQSRGSWCGWQLRQTWTGTEAEAEAASAEPNSHGGQRKKALLSAWLSVSLLHSVWVYECVCAHTQSLRTGTDESARLQPCSVQCIMGFQSLSLSPLSLCSMCVSLSSSRCWHSVRGGCPRLLSGERRVNSHALCPHTHNAEEAS